jgi:hypothetical protein
MRRAGSVVCSTLQPMPDLLRTRASICGVTHSKMENWISGPAISIPEYKPLLLGQNPTRRRAGSKSAWRA